MKCFLSIKSCFGTKKHLLYNTRGFSFEKRNMLLFKNQVFVIKTTIL